MKETVRPAIDIRERAPNNAYSVTVIGDACSGKTTLLEQLRDTGYTVRPEPDNPVFSLFLKNPKKYAYHNQLYKLTQLMGEEMLGHESRTNTSPYFNESGVLATDIYNRYLRDEGLITEEQFDHLNGIYLNYLNSMPKPDLVIYLFADDDTIRERAIKRDGMVAHDPQKLQPYWDRLLGDLEARGIPVQRVNTGSGPVEQTEVSILKEAQRRKHQFDVPAF